MTEKKNYCDNDCPHMLMRRENRHNKKTYNPFAVRNRFYCCQQHPKKRLKSWNGRPLKREYCAHISKNKQARAEAKNGHLNIGYEDCPIAGMNSDKCHAYNAGTCMNCFVCPSNKQARADAGEGER